jgi:hypothetical protein
MMMAFYIKSYFNGERKTISYCKTKNNYSSLGSSNYFVKFKSLAGHDRKISFCNLNFGFSKMSSSIKRKIILF